MRFEQVVDQEGGTVFCIENGATITISGKGDSKTYHPDRPPGAVALPLETFRQQYAAKHFASATPKAAPKTSKGD